MGLMEMHVCCNWVNGVYSRWLKMIGVGMGKNVDSWGRLKIAGGKWWVD